MEMLSPRIWEIWTLFDITNYLLKWTPSVWDFPFPMPLPTLGIINLFCLWPQLIGSISIKWASFFYLLHFFTQNATHSGKTLPLHVTSFSKSNLSHSFVGLHQKIISSHSSTYQKSFPLLKLFYIFIGKCNNLLLWI